MIISKLFEINHRTYFKDVSLKNSLNIKLKEVIEMHLRFNLLCIGKYISKLNFNIIRVEKSIIRCVKKIMVVGKHIYI